MAIPALVISLNALKVSEQQAAQAAQQFANRITALPTSIVRPGYEEDIVTIPGTVDDDGMMLFHVRLRNTNSVPVVVEGALYESADGGDPFLETDFLILNLPACTEGTFEMSGSERKLQHAGVRLYTRNALDGRYWTVPEPGQQARPVEAAVNASANNSSIQMHGRPKQSKVISPCV
ncbi:hypothetical protein [Nonomuraea sp. B19D2]|uniref:hypothetical protein n=1 Tax=Nonomuraea sp. B19D2 TaxID=3159561 RepID=UPI0032DAA446